MPGTRQILGARAERAAARYLRRHGYSILERNFRVRHGEIDIVALDRGVIVFVEVKARLQSRFGEPLEAVDRRKQRQIARAAEDFVRRHRLHDRAIRFDVVGMRPRRWFGWDVELVRDAFDVPGSFWS